MVDVLGSADKAHGSHSEPPVIEAFFDRCNDLFIIRQAKVVVGTHIYHLLFTDPDTGSLGRCYMTLGFIKAGFGDFFQFVLELIPKFSIHGCLLVQTTENRWQITEDRDQMSDDRSVVSL
jgi:hypothetical protein